MFDVEDTAPALYYYDQVLTKRIMKEEFDSTRWEMFHHFKLRQVLLLLLLLLQDLISG